MRTPHVLPNACVIAASFLLASNVPAQCWTHRLASPSDFAGDFGFRLAMSDRHLIIGDSRDHTMCGDVSCANGYAWAYQRDAQGQWVFTQRLEPSDLGWSWGFGFAVALDGDRALITRRLALDCNMVFEFEFDGEQWVEVGPICVPPLSGVDGSGVELRGDMAIVRTLDGVLVYQDQAEEWTLTDWLFNPDVMRESSSFGIDSDFDDEWLVIGAPTERLTAGFGGAAYVYRRLPGGDLEFAQKLVAPDILSGPQFGASVALDGDTLVVGGNNSTRTFISQGAVYVYGLFGGQWQLEQELTHSEPMARDRFGVSLALEGNLLVVGAGTDSTPLTIGAAYLFSRGADGRWAEVGPVLPDQPAYQYGFDVDIYDGMAAIGARDTLVSGEPTGSVDIFELSCNLCPPDLDADGTLTIFDFLLFFNAFDAGDATADFDGDGELTLFDFLAFQTAFDAGCE